MKVVCAAAIRLPGLHVAVRYEKVNMNMVGVGMHCEQHFITFAVNEMLGEILRYLECQFVIKFPVIIGVE